MDEPAEKLLKKNEVADMIRVHPRSVMRYVARGDLPKPIYLDHGRRCPRWRPDALRAWLDQKGTEGVN